VKNRFFILLFLTLLAASTIDTAFASTIDLTGQCVCTNAISIEHGKEGCVGSACSNFPHNRLLSAT